MGWLRNSRIVPRRTLPRREIWTVATKPEISWMSVFPLAIHVDKRFSSVGSGQAGVTSGPIILEQSVFEGFEVLPRASALSCLEKRNTSPSTSSNSSLSTLYHGSTLQYQSQIAGVCSSGKADQAHVLAQIIRILTIFRYTAPKSSWVGHVI